MMTTTEGRTTAVGVFSERALAERALAELHKSGFSDDQVGFIARHSEYVVGDVAEEESSGSSVQNAATGAVGGGIIGGIVGAAVSLLIPGLGPAIAGGILLTTLGTAAIGALAGGFVGSMVNMGVPEDEAHYYEAQLAEGRTLVTVNAPGRYEEAAALLRQCGAYDARVRENIPADPMTSGFSGADPGTPGIIPPAIPALPLGVGGNLGVSGLGAGYVPVAPYAGDDLNRQPEVEATDGSFQAYSESPSASEYPERRVE